MITYSDHWRAELSDRELQRSFVVSLGLHVVAVLVLWLGLPAFLPPIPPLTQIVPVEIADVGAITNTRVKPQPAPPKPQPLPPKPVDQPKPQPKPVTSNPSPAQPQPTPPAPQEPEALPEKPTEIKKPEPKKPEPKKVEDQPKPDALASVLRNLAQIKPKSGPKTVKPQPKQEESEDEPDDDAPSLSDRLTVSEEDALRRQIGGCWNVPIGARNAEELVVQVLITVNPDRTVQSVKVVDQMRMATDNFFRAAAESAVRALRHPSCSPLALPQDKYEQWKVIRFNFDPRDML